MIQEIPPRLVLPFHLSVAQRFMATAWEQGAIIPA